MSDEIAPEVEPEVEVAPQPAEPKPFKLTGDEWREMLLSLEEHHGVFYKLWSMGMPIFTTQIDTAAVSFSKGGDLVAFLFNPHYWQKCTPYERKFVICHEALHVILNHGVRIKDSEDREMSNIALDVVVNHMLTRCFAFDRDQISNWEKLCWVDTVFKRPDGKIRHDPRTSRPIAEDESFEYYLNMLAKHGMPKCGKGKQGQGNPCQGQQGQGGGQGNQQGDGQGQQPGDGLQTLDDHEVMSDPDNDWGAVIDRLDEELSDDEKETIKSQIEKHFQPSPSQRAGTHPGGQWHIANVKKVPKKKKWESVIKKWVQTKIQEKDSDEEQWSRLNRRMVMLPRDMFLPSQMEIEDRVKDKNRIKVLFFLDTSGSCWHLKDRFFTAATSIPEDRFDVRLFCFDTSVYPTDLKDKKMHGGGGTYFHILEQYIQRMMQQDGDGRYPDAVWVLTDGYGDRVTPAMPDRWYWFLEGSMTAKSLTSSYCPEECAVFKLTDFE